MHALSVRDHRSHEQVELLEGKAKGEELGVLRDGMVVELNIQTSALGLLASHDVGQLEHLGVEPVGKGSASGRLELELAVIDDATLDGVDEEHLAGLQAALAGDLLGLEVDRADLVGRQYLSSSLCS
jgi:hypothetical protein